MSARINKYLYGWKLYVNYGQGWEYETFEETFAGYKETARPTVKTATIHSAGVADGS